MFKYILHRITNKHSIHNNSEELPRRPSKSSKPYKKVRLKCHHSHRIITEENSTMKMMTKNHNHKFIGTTILPVYLSILLGLSLCINPVCCNRPPKFLLEGQSEIVLRLKEGPETPVGKYF